MSRADTERDIIQTLGQVPIFFEDMPDDTLEREWQEWKTFQMEDSAISAREKQLIGFAVAAAIHCPYCTYFHQAATEMMGTSKQQLEEAARMAAETAKYSTYLHGLQVPVEDFKRQADEMGEYIQSHQQVSDGYSAGLDGSGMPSEAEGTQVEGASSLEETMKDIREQAA
jgi:AhpD family alkylhydroperoxidase